MSPTKSGQPSSADQRSRDPRLKSPGLKSPGLPVTTQVPVGPAQSLTVKVAGDCKPKDPRLVTGLLTVAVPATASPASPSPSPSPRLARPRTPPLHVETDQTPSLAPTAPNTEPSDPSTMDIDERIKLLKERFDAWDGHTRQLGSGSARQDQASRFNLDRRPSQPSAIVQQLLSRKSVFDEDSRRLERTNEPSETDQGGRTPSTPSTPSTPGLSLNTAAPAPAPAPVRDTNVKPESASPSPSSEKSSGVAPLSESAQTTPSHSLPREIPTMPLTSLSPVRPSPVRQNSSLSPSPASRQFFPSPVQSSKVPEDPSTRPLPLPSKAGTSVSAVTFPIKPLVDKLSKPAAFTKPSATVTPTLKSTGLTASSVKPTVFTTTSTKTVSTSTMVPSAQNQTKAVEKGEASSTTCSPKPDSALSELTSVTSSLSSQDTDSDPNVTSTTGTESKKKVDKDIKTIKKEFDSLTSFKDKKEMREELFAPTATIIQQVKPKYDKIEKKPNSSSKFDLFDVKKAKEKLHKDKLLSSKEKKDKLKVKQKNDLKGFLTAEAPIRKLNEKKSETSQSVKKEEKLDAKRRLSVNSELDDLEPKSKVAKLKSESDCESEAKKLKTEPMKPMGRIPKLEKKEDKRERTDSVRSLDSTADKEKDKDKHKSHSKSKSKHDERHRHKSSDRTEDRGKDKHKKKKKEKDRDRDKDKEAKPKVDASKSRSISTDEDKHHKKPKKSKDSKHRDKKDFKTESKDRVREKDKKDKHREKDKDKEKEKERKRKKEDDERRKAEHLRKKKKLDDSSNSGNSDDSSDGEDRKFSIFEEPVFDENNPVYFSMYDKVKARRSCVKAKEEEEQKRQEEALKKFAKLKAQRAKREGKKKSVDSEDSLSDEEMPSFEDIKEDLKSKKKPSLIDSSSDSDEEANNLKKKKKSKSLGSPGENRKRAFKTKRTVVDSSDDDSDDDTQKPTSKTLSKLESSDSDDNTEKAVKKNSFLESDSEREMKTKIKTESDLCDNDQTKLKSKSVTESDSELEHQKSLALLSKPKHKSKDKSSVKVEPLSTDSEEEKVDVSKFNIKREIKKEIKSEKSSVKESKGFDGKSKGISSKKDKKKSKDESQKEKSLLGQKLKTANLFGTSSEDESTSRTTKPPTPVTNNTSKLMANVQPAKPVKLNIEQIYSDSEPDKRNDSPAIESDSSDGIPSRPPTPTFPTVKIEESKAKANDEVEEIPVKTSSSKEDKNSSSSSDKMFDSLLTINVDCPSKQSSKKSPSSLAKSPGSLKSPGKSGGSAGTTLSPGSHRSPLISPGGKPTYLLAQMHDKLASMEAEKIHRAQEKESKKRVTDKTPKDSFKTKKDVADVSKKVEIKQTKSVTEKHDQDGKVDVQNKDDKNKETLCLSETDSDSNEITFKKVQLETTTKTEEQRKSKGSKLSSRQPSDESTDENCSLVIDLDSKKEKEKSVFDFNDDSEEGFDSKPSLESGRKPLREAFKISPKSSQTSYASFAAGTISEASSSPSAATEFKNVVILSDESPTSNDSSRKSPTDDLVILEKESSGEEEQPVLTKQQQLEKSIASITGEQKPDVLSESGGNFSQSAAETERKRTVISQEETESAVNALLGESFDSFDADAVAGSQVENMDEDPVNSLADDEAAAAVAGLAGLSDMSAGAEDWARTEKVQAERVRPEEKQEDESIENIAAEIRRSSTEEKTAPESSKTPPRKTEIPAKQETVKKEEVKPVEQVDPKPMKTKEVEPTAPASQNDIEMKELKAEEKTKVQLVSSEVSVAEAPPAPLESKQQTRVIPVGVAPVKMVTGPQVSPSKVSAPAPVPSTVVIPTAATPLVSKEQPQTTPASPLQPLRLSIDETLSPSLTISSPSSRSPRQRMRRSTGGNSRESEEESAVTKQKINLILQHAKQEAERAAQHQPVSLPSYRVTDSGLPINLISQSASQSQELLIDPKTGQAVRLASPASSVTLTLVTPSGAGDQPRGLLNSGGPRAGIPQPTVLPPRHEQQVRPPARMVTAPVRPPVAPGPPRQTLPIQLPTQPLPPESVRKTQPVLLEQNSKVGPVGSVTTSLPRSVSLPTEPVPMSVASKMPSLSLPRTPLPLTSAQLVTSRQLPQTVTSSARQVVTSTVTRPSPAVTAVSRAQHLAQETGQRTLLGKREEEMELKQKEQQEPLALPSQVKVQRDFLQPREREAHRPASTPLTPLSKEEEKSQQPPAAHVFPVPVSHPQIMDSPEYRAMELWRLRIDLSQQLVAAGTPEHLVQNYVEKLLGERMMMEMMSQAARSQPVHEEPRPGSVPPNMMRHLEELRLQQQTRQPLPAHSDPYRSDSPMFSPHVVGHPYPGPPSAHMVPQPAHSGQPMRLTQSPGVSDYSTRSRPASPAYTPTTDYTLPHLAAYPICWTGTLGLKNEMANVRMHYVAGNRDLAMASLPSRGSTLKIMQRMRLEDSQLEGVARKMETAGEHCMLLALPNGSEHDEIELQSRNLRHSFITYLQLKAAAGIVNVSNEDNQPAYIVHVFPSCDFANVNLAR